MSEEYPKTEDVLKHTNIILGQFVTVINERDRLREAIDKVWDVVLMYDGVEAGECVWSDDVWERGRKAYENLKPENKITSDNET